MITGYYNKDELKKAQEWNKKNPEGHLRALFYPKSERIQIIRFTPSSGGLEALGSVEIEPPEYWGMGQAKIIDPTDQIDYGEYIEVRRT